jgi:hypothetical protein
MPAENRILACSIAQLVNPQPSKEIRSLLMQVAELRKSGSSELALKNPESTFAAARSYFRGSG